MARQVPECAPAHAPRRARALRAAPAQQRARAAHKGGASGQTLGALAGSGGGVLRLLAVAWGRYARCLPVRLPPQAPRSRLGAPRGLADWPAGRAATLPARRRRARSGRRPSAARRPPCGLRRRGERARAVTTVFGSLDLGSAIGLLICGPLINAFGWPSVFWLFALLGLAWCLAWPLVRPEEPDPAVARGSSPAPASGPKRARPSAPSPCTPGLPHACGLICGPERARPSAPLFHAHPAHHVLWPRPAAPPCRRSCARATWPL